jgi:glycosyltransferase involved in cell wall biosynthesis
MHLVIFRHPAFLKSQSMPRFADMLGGAYSDRGISVEDVAPKPYFYRIPHWASLGKWLGYVDQYIIFPLRILQIKRKYKHRQDILYVFCDQALGPWVPFLRDKPHVVHTHDLLALRSALGDFPENPTSRTGYLYQMMIRYGFSQGSRFIAVSEKTKTDLVKFGGISPSAIDVVYNGFNQEFRPIPVSEVQKTLNCLDINVDSGWFIHVGGNQWYKNTRGVIALYAEYVRRAVASGSEILALLLVIPAPNDSLLEFIGNIPSEGKVILRYKLSSNELQAAYCGAVLLLFPSIAEGFGWPIIEAQACGTLVLTTNDSPMNEIGGPAAFYVPRLEFGQSLSEWIDSCIDTLVSAISLSPEERISRINLSLLWLEQFEPVAVISRYLSIYEGELNVKSET